MKLLLLLFALIAINLNLKDNHLLYIDIFGFYIKYIFYFHQFNKLTNFIFLTVKALARI